MVGNNVSHSKRRTKRKFNVNLFNKKFFWVEEQAWITLTISAAGLRTINKKGPQRCNPGCRCQGLFN